MGKGENPGRASERTGGAFPFAPEFRLELGPPLVYLPPQLNAPLSLDG
jgi:hypothetical protein